MTGMLTILMIGVALVAILALLLRPLVRRANSNDDFHTAALTHRRARRLALLAQAGRRYHQPHHAAP